MAKSKKTTKEWIEATRGEGIHPHHWRFIQFLEYLEDHNGRILLELPRADEDSVAETREYSNNMGPAADLRELVALTCDMSRSSVCELFFTNKDPLTKVYSIHQKVRDPQIRIIESIPFYFETEEPSTEVPPFSSYKRTHIYKRNEQYFPIENGLLGFYPDIKENIHRKVLSGTEKLLDQDFMQLFKNMDPCFPLYDLLQEVRNYYLHDDNKVEAIDELRPKLDRIKSEYEKAHNSEYSAFGTSIPQKFRLLPDYNSFHELFEIDDPFSGSIDIEGDYVKRSIFLVGYIGFNGTRYRILADYKDELKGKKIEDRPDKVIEHFILSCVEYLAIKDELFRIMEYELTHNLRFEIYSSKDGNMLELQCNQVKLEELSTLLSFYKLHPDLVNFFEIDHGEILHEPIKKLPDKELAKSGISEEVIYNKLKYKLVKHLFEKLAFHSGFKALQDDEMVLQFLEEDYPDLWEPAWIGKNLSYPE